MEKKKEKEENSTSGVDHSVSRPWQSYHTVYTNAKAGMDGVDKEKVQRVVYEMSKGSKYFENEERKEALMRQKTENMRARCAKLSSTDVSHYQKVAERRISELETTRDLSRIWLHVDMDAFYAAVETLSNPSLKGKPVAVGGMSMISTANYEARKFGVRAAMPGFIARKLCPELIFVPTDFEKYTHYSSLTRKVFKRYDPNFIAGSLDEAYLDITNVCIQRDISSEEVAEEIRRSVFEETGLTCSAGVAPNRLLAKVCSDINKPNGQFILPNDRLAVITFISSLPIRKIGGIGKVTEHILRDIFEIKTCEELLQKGGYFYAFFSRSSADFFLSVGLGLGSTHAPEERLRKSMSNERTFSATDKEAFLYQKLAELAEMLSSDLQKEGLRGRNLTLKLKTASFEVRSRAVTLQKYICASEDILWHAKKLLKAELPASLRLIGLRLSQFSGEGVGPSDPSQRPITNFIKSGDALVKNVHGHGTSVSGLDVKHSDAANDITNDLCGCDCVHVDDLHSDCFSDFSFSNCDIGENATGMSRSSDQVIQAEDSFDMAITPAVVGHVTELHEPAACLSLDTSLPPLGCQTVDQSSGCTNSERDDAVPSLLAQDNFQWVDDYKCSICGIEMPPDFSDERQEHFDFHLAERLQEECSSSAFTSELPRQRIIQKEPVASPSRRKRRKSLGEEGRYLRIDKFFTKKSQNS